MHFEFGDVYGQKCVVQSFVLHLRWAELAAYTLCDVYMPKYPLWISFNFSKEKTRQNQVKIKLRKGRSHMYNYGEMMRMIEVSESEMAYVYL